MNQAEQSIIQGSKNVFKMFGRRKKTVMTGDSGKLPVFPEYWIINQNGSVTITSYVRKRFGKWYLIPVITREDYTTPWADISGAVLNHQRIDYRCLLFHKFAKNAVESTTGFPIYQLLDENQQNEFKRLGVGL